MQKDDSLIKMLHPDENILGAGSYGIIYDNYDGTATKVLRGKTINPGALIKIKELNLKNFYKVLDIYTRNNEIGNPYLKAYRMDIIDEDNTLLVNSNKDFVFDNIYSLVEDLRILSNNYIYANDLHCDNLMVNKEGIKVIDCDMYKYMLDYPVDFLFKNNCDLLKEAICELLCEELHQVSLFRTFKKKRIHNLFDEKSFDEIYKELNDSKTILEYIKK